MFQPHSRAEKLCEGEQMLRKMSVLVTQLTHKRGFVMPTVWSRLDQSGLSLRKNEAERGPPPGHLLNGPTSNPVTLQRFTTKLSK